MDVGRAPPADADADGNAVDGWDWDVVDRLADDLRTDVCRPTTLARALRRRGWPRVKPYRPRKKRAEVLKERQRMESCMQVAVQNADLANAILRLDDTNFVAASFKEHCSVAKLRAVPPANADSVASRAMEPFKHLYWDWMSVIETGVMPPLIPYLPASFVRDIKIVLRKKNDLRWCSAGDVIVRAEQMRFEWRQTHVYKREFSERGQAKIVAFNAKLRAELDALQPLASSQK